MIPYPALVVLEKQLDEPSPWLYYQLSRVNKAFRTLFRSDAAWERFNVYGVEDVCDDYIHELRNMPVKWQRFHMDLRNAGGSYNDSLDLTQLDQYDRYTQLMSLSGQSWRGRVLFGIDDVHIDVWRKWAQLPQPSRGTMFFGLENNMPWLLEERDIYLKLIRSRCFDKLLPQYEDDRDALIAFAKFKPNLLPERHLKDREVVLAALRSYTINEDNWSLVSEELRKDKEFMLAASRSSSSVLKYAAPELLEDVDFVKDVIRRGPFCMQFAPEAVKDDKEFLCELLSNPLRSYAFSYVSERLRDDEEVVDLVLDTTPSDTISFFFQYISERLKDSKRLAEKVVSREYVVFRYLSKRLQGDRDVVKLASQCPMSSAVLMHCPDELRGDRELVESLMEQDPWSYEYASPELRDDLELTMKAIEVDGFLLQYASERLKDHPEVCLYASFMPCKRAVACKNGDVPLMYASEAQRDNENLVTMAVNSNHHAFKVASDRLKDNKDLALLAVRQGETPIRHVSERLRDDADVILASVETNKYGLKYASERLQGDAAFVAQVVAINGLEIFNAAEPLRDDRSLALKAVQTTGAALQHVSLRLAQDKEVVLAAVRNDRAAIQYAVGDLVQDEEVQEVVRTSPYGSGSRYIAERTVALIDDILDDQIKWRINSDYSDPERRTTIIRMIRATQPSLKRPKMDEEA